MNGFDLHVLCRCYYNANFKTVSPPMRSIRIHFSLCLSFQTSMNRKQAENVAKKKLDNLMKESKIRDREDPDSFTIAALPPTGKHDKSPLKVNMLYFTHSTCTYVSALPLQERKYYYIYREIYLIYCLHHVLVSFYGSAFRLMLFVYCSINHYFIHLLFRQTGNEHNLNGPLTLIFTVIYHDNQSTKKEHFYYSLTLLFSYIFNCSSSALIRLVLSLYRCVCCAFF